jgi:hypothetical protein
MMEKKPMVIIQNKRWLTEVPKYRGKSWPGIENKDYETTEQTRNFSSIDLK